jgi:hypothetical protein
MPVANKEYTPLVKTTGHIPKRCGALKNETLNSRKIEKYNCNGYNIYRTRNFNKIWKNVLSNCWI